jgi:glutaminase
VLDLSRVPMMTSGAAKMLAEFLTSLPGVGVTPVLSGLERGSGNRENLKAFLGPDTRVRDFTLLDEAIEWAEDQIIFRFGGFTHLMDTIDLSQQELLTGLPGDLIVAIGELGVPKTFHTGERIITGGEASSSLFFLQSGMVSVKLSDGVRLATLVPGMAFGEMALVDGHRAADVWADTAVRCIELPLDRFYEFRKEHPQIGEHIMRNLAGLLARRLGRANTRIDLLSAS